MNTKTIPPNARPVSFWLVPAEADRHKLTKLINRLADEYNAPRFLPHVTLLATKLTKNEEPLKILQSATKGISPLKLEILGVAHSPDRFKSVFIQLNNAPIVPLYNAFRSSCHNPGNYRLDAHLSLIYRQLPVTKRNLLISKLKIPQGSLHFDSVIAVRPGHNKPSFDDVELWRLTDHVPLTAATKT